MHSILRIVHSILRIVGSFRRRFRASIRLIVVEGRDVFVTYDVVLRCRFTNETEIRRASSRESEVWCLCDSQDHILSEKRTSSSEVVAEIVASSRDSRDIIQPWNKVPKFNPFTKHDRFSLLNHCRSWCG